MENSDFSKLEVVVEKLLATLGAKKDENANLLRQIKDLDQTVVELEQEVRTLNSEQSEIGNRVSSLIGAIEDWEKDNNADSQPEMAKNVGGLVDASEEKSSANSNQEEPLFSMGK